MTYEYAKVFGERNTGTNWLEEILRHNTSLEILPGDVPRDWRAPYEEELTSMLPQDAEVRKQWLISQIIKEREDETFGWKHRQVDWSLLAIAGPKERLRRFRKTLFVCIVRDPYKWLTSLYRRPYSAVFVGKHLPAREGWGGFSNFIRTPWICTERDGIRKTWLESPADLWGRKVASFDYGAAPNVVLVRYEDLITDSDSFFDSIQEKVELKGRRIKFANTKGDINREFPQLLEEVQTRSYLQHYSESDLEYVRDFFYPVAGWNRFGYEEP